MLSGGIAPKNNHYYYYVALAAVTGRLNYSVAFYDISLTLRYIAALFRQ